MGTVWHYEEKGERKEEKLDDIQAANDALIITQFQKLEGMKADLKDPNLDEASVANVFELADTLPTHRKAHQLAEFARIGLKKPKKEAPKA